LIDTKSAILLFVQWRASATFRQLPELASESELNDQEDMREVIRIATRLSFSFGLVVARFLSKSVVLSAMLGT